MPAPVDRTAHQLRHLPPSETDRYTRNHLNISLVTGTFSLSKRHQKFDALKNSVERADSALLTCDCNPHATRPANTESARLRPRIISPISNAARKHSDRRPGVTIPQAHTLYRSTSKVWHAPDLLLCWCARPSQPSEYSSRGSDTALLELLQHLRFAPLRFVRSR